MSTSFRANDSLVLDRQLKVQKVSIPFTVTANATPASKAQSTDEPAVLFLRTEGVDGITTTSGALSSGEVMPGSLVSLSDASGNFIALCKVREPLAKIISVNLVGRGATAINKSCQVLALTTGTGGGQSAVCNVRSGVNLATTDLDAVLEISYVVDDNA
jgi:hypothetical protein